MFLIFSNYDYTTNVLSFIYSQDASGAPYPVMVWLYGGGYITGGSVQYPGHFLASKDVVIVVINYRIRAYGNNYFITKYTQTENYFK